MGWTNKLLDVAKEAMKKNEEQLELIKEECGGKSRGVEEWFRIELEVELKGSEELEYKRYTGQKNKGHPDLEVNGKLVELKMEPKRGACKIMVDAFEEKNPSPNLVFFLTMYHGRFKEKLEELDYEAEFKCLSEDWMVGYLRKID